MSCEGKWTESEGGVITSSHHASYLFSSDADHRDTQRIYNSLDYVENKATIFHANFLKTSARSKTSNLMSLGQFILPPACLHKEIRRTIGSFIWEQGDTLYEKQDTEMPCDPEENHHSSPEGEVRNDVFMSDSETSEEGMCHTLQNYPVNNMCTGYISIDLLKKFPGELHDFTPDSSGYNVCYMRATVDNLHGIKHEKNKIDIL
ncbi:telomere repeats-binding bouquet formation protein 2 isoform X2 [Hyperolius riggenbachi]|uniref:telomere repeats-binding bouquet formation protein 2 isoform X2 n=1 Tax=Hyperolius riggenbachi TaxID=752182 RepID=UPI0035A3092F